MSEQKILFEIYLDNGEFKVKAKEASDGLGKIGDSAKKSEGAFSKLKSSWVGTTLAIGALALGVKKLISVFGDTVKAASNLQETQNKFDVVFKNSKKQADAFAKTLVDAYGMAKEESMAFLAGTGDILQGLGMQSDKALELSNSVAQLGTDLASFSNVEGGAERAINALSSALTGEREALKAYGIVINEEMIKAELQAQGKEKLTGLSLTQAKAEATIALAYQQSGNAIGDMARSFNSYANIQRRVESSIADQKAGIGDKLIPALSGLGLVFLETSKDGNFFSGAMQAVAKTVAGLINGLAILLNLMEYASNKGKKAGAENFIRTGTKGFEDKLKEIDNKYKDEAKLFGVSSYKFMMEKAKAGDETAKQYIKELAIIKKDIDQAEKDIVGFDSKAAMIRGDWTGEKNLNTVAQNKAIEDRLKNKKNTNTTPTGDGKEKQANVASIYTLIDTDSEASARAMQSELDNINLAHKQGLISKKEFEEAKFALEKKYTEDSMVAFNKKLEAMMGGYQTFTSGFTQLSSGLSEVIAMSASNQTANIDNETQAQMEVINTRYQTEVDAINNSASTAEQKAVQLKALDEKKAREEKALQDAAAKEKRKIARETAEIQKKISLFETGVNIPTGAFMAWKSAQVLPFPASAVVGGALAAGATALGLAKLKMINEQPLPSYAVGSWAIPQDQVAQVHKGEMIIPKTFADSVRAGEGAITGGGSSGGINIYVQGSVIDAQGLLEIVDDMQEKRASNMGATKYFMRSAY